MDLTKRTVRGGLWVLLARGVKWALQLGRTVVLARILFPNDFGLFGIAFLSLNLLDTFSRTGLWTALIQKDEAVESYLDTAWTIEIIRAAAIATGLFFASTGIARFFGLPEAAPLVKAAGLVIILQSLSNIAVVLYEKELAYDKYFTLEAARTLSEFIVALAAVFVLRNVWALMLGRIAGEAAYCAASYLIQPYRPGISLDLKKAGPLFTYGKWIMFSSILVFCITRGDDLFVGKVLGGVILGLYQMAYSFSALISTEMAFPVLKATFPAYSKIQYDLKQIKHAYVKVLQVISFLAFLMAFILLVLADNIVLTLLGQKWAPTAVLLRILVIPACLKAFQRTLVQLAKALGCPEVQVKVNTVQLIILALCIYPAAAYLGAAGVALAVLIQGVAAFVWAAGLVIPRIALSGREFAAAIARQLAAASISGAMLFLIQRRWPYNGFTLCLEVVLGTLLYIGMTGLLHRDVFQTLRSLSSGVFKTATRYEIKS
jgi:lipopolysaccharide exporter